MEYKTPIKKVNFFKGMLVAVATLATVLLTGTTFASGPQISTLPSTGVAQTTITLQGNFTGGTGTTQVRFDYGTTPLMGTFTAYQSFTGTTATFNETLTGLTPSTGYYIRAEGINGGGVGFGGTVKTATTGYQLPTAQTLPVQNPSTDITGSTAIVNGWYQSATSATVSIEYANNSGFIGSYTSSTLSEPAGSGAYAITLTGLTANTTYYYRAVVTNNGGTTTATSAFTFATTTGGGTGGTTTGGTTTGGTTGGSTGGTTGGTSGGTTGYSQPCYINFFTTTSSAITLGNSVTLSWVTGNCSSVYLSGPSVNGNQSPSGQITVTPGSGTSTYTLSASGNGSNPTSSITITTTGGGWYGGGNSNCYISSFYATPAQVSQGGSTTLNWNTQNCTSASVSGGTLYQQQQSTSGSAFVSNLYNTTTYTLTAYGISGTQVQTITVSVNTNPVVYPGVINPYVPPTTPTTIIRYITGNTTPKTTPNGSLILGSTVENGQGSYGNGSNLAGLALFGSSFMPTSLLGILLIIIIIMAIILITRKIYGNESENHAPQAAHH